MSKIIWLGAGSPAELEKALKAEGFDVRSDRVLKPLRWGYSGLFTEEEMHRVRAIAANFDAGPPDPLPASDAIMDAWRKAAVAKSLEWGINVDGGKHKLHRVFGYAPHFAGCRCDLGADEMSATADPNCSILWARLDAEGLKEPGRD